MAEDFHSAERQLRERIDNLKEAHSRHVCVREKAQAADAMQALERCVAHSPSLPWVGSLCQPLGFFAAVLCCVLGIYVVVRAVRASGRWLAVNSALEHEMQRLHVVNDDVRREAGKRLVCEAGQRGVQRRILFFSSIQIACAAAIIAFLGFSHIFMDAVLRRALSSWWSHLSEPFRRDAAAAAFDVRHDEEPSSTVLGRDAEGGARAASLLALFGATGLGTLPSLYIWYYVGTALLGLAVYLLKLSTSNMRATVFRHCSSGSPILRTVQRASDESRQALLIREAVLDGVRQVMRNAAASPLSDDSRLLASSPVTTASAVSSPTFDDREQGATPDARAKAVDEPAVED